MTDTGQSLRSMKLHCFKRGSSPVTCMQGEGWHGLSDLGSAQAVVSVGLAVACATFAIVLAVSLAKSHRRKHGSGSSSKPFSSRPLGDRERTFLNVVTCLGAAASLCALGILTSQAETGSLSSQPTLLAGKGPDLTVTTVTMMASTHSTLTTTLYLDSIFVSIASYRDTECQATLEGLFATAEHPQRVFVGLVEQNKHANETCLRNADTRWLPQIRVTTISHLDSKGPTWGRYLAAQHYRGESYYFQLDSHMRFERDWDSRLIDMLARTQVPKPVLTTYPLDYPDIGVTRETPVLCGSAWNERGILAFTAGKMAPAPQPRPVPFIAAGFVFAPGSVVMDVPFDPDLPNLFAGEEILHAARLWTSGYDFFSPDVNLVYHKYVTADAEKKSGHRPKYWEDVKGFYPVEKTSEQKVRYLLGWSDEKPEDRAINPKYGFGSARSLPAYWDFAAVNPRPSNLTEKTGSDAKFCPRTPV